MMKSYLKKFPLVNAIYVVDTDKDGKKISSKEFKKRINEVEDTFLKFFGGYANEDISHGKFISKTGKIIKEKVARIRSFTDPIIYSKNKKAVEKWLIEKKKEWKQEAIAYEYDGNLYYI